MLRMLKRIAVDVRPLRESREFRLLVTGQAISSMGTQGDIESGFVAGLTSAATSVLTGGIACVVGAGAVVLSFPALLSYNRGVAEAAPEAALAESPAGHGGL